MVDVRLDFDRANESSPNRTPSQVVMLVTFKRVSVFLGAGWISVPSMASQAVC